MNKFSFFIKILFFGVACFVATIFIFPETMAVVESSKSNLAFLVDRYEVEVQEIQVSDLFQIDIENDMDFVQARYLKNFTTEKKNEFILKQRDFLEVNLSEMKINVFQKGFLEKSFSILAIGDPDFWAGTPTGLYDVISKNANAYSAAAEVYMPWSINFYGKYYIHGEPYFYGGQKTNFNETGGCIRLIDNDAKQLYNLAEKEMPILVVDRKNRDYHNRDFFKSGLISGVSAKSYLVADLDSGFVFSEKNFQTQLPIASLTKLMTAVIVAEQVDLRKSILVRKWMIEPFESFSWFFPKLEIGERYSVVELFYPLLIESSNDVAEAISYFLGRGATIDFMNEKAISIGMQNTKFVGPSGLDEKNISTAQDLFYLGKYIFDVRSPLLKISKSEKVLSFGSVSFKDLKNKNIFSTSSDFLGGKTGYIEASDYNGLFLFNFANANGQDYNILIVLLGSNGLEKDVLRSLEWLNN